MIYDPLFSQAVALVLLHEGGLHDDPADPGGLTNWGFALDRNPDLTADELRTMTQEQATARYFDRWWQPYRWRDLSPAIAIKAFDCAVPLGAKRAIEALQRACRAAGREVTVDGDLGPQTIGAAGYVSAPVLLAALKSEIAAEFRITAALHPALARDLDGWCNRAYG